MNESRHYDDDPARPVSCASSIDEQLLERAVEINEAIAGELAEHAVAPLENPLLGQIAQLGVETDAAVSVALKRARWIAFYMRGGRTPPDETELAAESRELPAEDPAQVAALAVAWWDGILTALRARDLERRRGSS